MAKVSSNFKQVFAEFIDLSKSREGIIFTNELYVAQEIRLEGDFIIWNSSGEYLKKKHDEFLVSRFTNLASEDSNGILKFAKNWGTLGLCEHGLPYTHSSFSTIDGKENCQPTGRESIEDWISFSKNFRGLHNISTRLLNSHASDESEFLRGNKSDWLTLLNFNDAILPKTVKDEKELFQNSVNFWLLSAGVRPQYDLSDKLHDVIQQQKLHLSHSSKNSLIGELAKQLTFNTAKAQPILTCSNCGRSGTSEEIDPDRIRKHKSGAKVYCQDCRINRMPQKQAEQKYRNKKRKIT